MTTVRTMTFEMFQDFCRDAHKANHANAVDPRGEQWNGYATDAEMEMHLDDPTAMFELVSEQVIAETGWTCERGGQVKQIRFEEDMYTITYAGLSWVVDDIVDDILPVISFDTLKAAKLYGQAVAIEAEERGY